MTLIPRTNLFDFDRIFNDFWSPASANTPSNTFFSPRVDIKEKNGHYEISAELPGVDKKDIQVNINDGILVIEAKINHEDTEEKDGRILRRERRYGKFMRSFDLGGDVREKDIKASFKDGVLKLEAPKTVETAPKRHRIEVH